MFVLYRVSEKSNLKKRVEGDKFEILLESIKVFSSFNFVVIADNCSNDFIEKLKKIKSDKCIILKTEYGNSKSFWYAYNYAINNFKNEDIVYFLEDDYLHLSGSESKLIEGLEVFDYVTLYDHPDKYNCNYLKRTRMGYSLSENTRLCYVNNVLWKTSSSTTMTFAAHVRTLKEDKIFWGIATKLYAMPKDLLAWTLILREKPINKPSIWHRLLRLFFILKQNNKRYLGIPIDGWSTHMEINYLSKKFKEHK